MTGPSMGREQTVWLDEATDRTIWAVVDIPPRQRGGPVRELRHGNQFTTGQSKRYVFDHGYQEPGGRVVVLVARPVDQPDGPTVTLRPESVTVVHRPTRPATTPKGTP